MAAKISIAVIIFILITYSDCESVRFEKSLFGFMQPKIEVFSPRGFRVNVKAIPGASSCEFQANVNRPLNDLESVTYSTKVHYSENGRWIIEYKEAEFHIGDQIYYRLIVDKDKTKHSQNARCFLVKELLPSPYEPQSSDIDSPIIFEDVPEVPIRKLVTDISTPPSNSWQDLIRCKESILNTTQMLLDIRVEVEKTNQLNKQLLKAMEEYPASKQMKLSGGIPPDGTPATIVQFIMREKLGFKPKIIWAVREDTNTIIFEVPSVLEKYEALAIANEKLLNSRINLN